MNHVSRPLDMTNEINVLLEKTQDAQKKAERIVYSTLLNTLRGELASHLKGDWIHSNEALVLISKKMDEYTKILSET